jgi:hypothetical protein
MGMKALLNKAGFSKRLGTPIYELVYVFLNPETLAIIINNEQNCTM